MPRTRPHTLPTCPPPRDAEGPSSPVKPAERRPALPAPLVPGSPVTSPPPQMGLLPASVPPSPLAHVQPGPEWPARSPRTSPSGLSPRLPGNGLDICEPVGSRPLCAPHPNHEGPRQAGGGHPHVPGPTHRARYSRSSHFRPNFLPILLIRTMGVSPIFFRISGKILGDFALEQSRP